MDKKIDDFPCVNQIHEEKWSNFIYNHHDGNIFQTPEIFKVYTNTDKYDPKLFCILDNNEEIMGLTIIVTQNEFSGILNQISARSITWGGPLITEKLLDKKGRMRILNKLLQEIKKHYKKKSIYVQFRNIFNMDLFKNSFIRNGYRYEDHMNYLINLTKSEEELWSALNKGRRKGIKKANQLNFEFIHDDSISIEMVYSLLEDTYNNIRIPLADISFFKSLYRFLLSKKMLHVFGIKKDNELISTRLSLGYKTLLYDFYAGARDRLNTNLANEYLVWKILLWGKKKGYYTFDFGGGGNPKTEYGPREFKRRFGGEEVQYGRFQIVNKPKLLKIANFGIKILKR